ncbi:acyltransferase [Micromonospora sp. CPCC 205371]|nr:acyltransferase [Micromonospora sp. CPCC 205371]
METAVRDLVARIEAATPPDRDRAVDALRALAVAGVVFGHWLVTALVVDSGTVHGASPLRHLPVFVPVSWVFQTLAVFFLVGGLVATRGYARGVPYGRWVATRTGRLFRPVAAVLVVWVLVAGVLLASGVDVQTVRTPLRLVLSPLWFLLVFAVLTAATPLVSKVHFAWPLAVVVLVDAVRLGLDGPAWLGWANVAAGWLVPYTIGAAWARGRLRDRTTLWALLAGGALATAALVRWAGYPASMVGVPGDGFSNLDPPSLAVVTFGLAQCGAAGLLLGPLRRLMRRPAAWAAVALVNLSTMTIFLWHQTAMIAVSALGLLTGRRLPGLHTVPDGPAWVVARFGWLPMFALALAVCGAAFHGYERVRPARKYLAWTR